MQNPTTTLTLPQITQHLLQDPTFISILRTKLTQPMSSPSLSLSPTQSPPQLPPYSTIIDQLSQLISLLIQHKLQKQMQNLIADNNNILEQIKENIEKVKSVDNVSNLSVVSRSKDTSLSQLQNMIDEEKRKVLEAGEEEGDVEGVGVGGMGVVGELQKKVKAMEEKYQTNFKSLWNVLSMTESAVFEYIRENKSKQKNRIENQLQASKKQKSIFNFWKTTS